MVASITIILRISDVVFLTAQNMVELAALVVRYEATHAAHVLENGPAAGNVLHLAHPHTGLSCQFRVYRFQTFDPLGDDNSALNFSAFPAESDLKRVQRIAMRRSPVVYDTEGVDATDCINREN